MNVEIGNEAAIFLFWEYLFQILSLQCGCSSRLSTKYFVPAVHYFNFCVPIAQQAGQTAVLGRLSFHMCLGECEAGMQIPDSIVFY